ncbi:hypothetical protein V9T40_009739 [Parthenolecanium corni]|uniref:Cas12f1-like TNB domain-containing protein n=1 Tax=Parthenolecanium corni TaxID=536013 RepID=A0AAN9Y6Z2_9HEMI
MVNLSHRLLKTFAIFSYIPQFLKCDQLFFHNVRVVEREANAYRCYTCGTNATRSHVTSSNIALVEEAAKAFHKVADKLFPSSDGDTAIWYGRGASFMNVARFRLKGVAKFLHDRLLAVLRQQCHIRVEEVDEAYTSRRCAKCWQRGNDDATVKGPSRQFRRHCYVHCPMCRTSANRDYNAAKNIYTKTRLSKLVGPSPRNVGSTLSTGP